MKSMMKMVHGGRTAIATSHPLVKMFEKDVNSRVRTSMRNFCVLVAVGSATVIHARGARFNVATKTVQFAMVNASARLTNKNTTKTVGHGQLSGQILLRNAVVEINMAVPRFCRAAYAVVLT